MRNNNSHLLSIGEVAKSLHITRRILLNYEDKGLVHPDVKEGKGGNRYYTTDTVTRIRAIRRLQSLGISLDEIKLYFEDKADLREFIGRLENMRDELDLCIEKLRLRVSENEEDVIEVREIPAQTVYIRRCSTPTVAHRMEIFRQDPGGYAPVWKRQFQADVPAGLPSGGHRRHPLLRGGAPGQPRRRRGAVGKGTGGERVFPWGLHRYPPNTGKAAGLCPAARAAA